MIKRFLGRVKFQKLGGKTLLTHKLFTVLSLIATLFVVIGNSASVTFAAGVPIVLENFTDGFGNVDVLAGTSKNVYSTPPLDSSKKYGGSIVAQVNMAYYPYDRTYGYLYGGTGGGHLDIYGSNDNVTWNYLGTFGNGSNTLYTPLLFSSIKAVLVSNLQPRYPGDPSYTALISVNITIPVFGLVADAQSVDNAQTAAQAAQQAAQQVNTIVNNTLTVTGGVVQDQQGTVLTAARAAQQLAQSANNKLDNVQNTLTQMQNNQLTIQNINQYLPATLRRISGVNGATATSSGALQVLLDYSNATQYAYQIDDGAWSSWMPISNKVSIPIPRGVHTLTVKVANGPVGQPGPDAVASMQVIGL